MKELYKEVNLICLNNNSKIIYKYNNCSVKYSGNFIIISEFNELDLIVIPISLDKIEKIKIIKY